MPESRQMSWQGKTLMNDFISQTPITVYVCFVGSWRGHEERRWCKENHFPHSLLLCLGLWSLTSWVLLGKEVHRWEGFQTLIFLLHLPENSQQALPSACTPCHRHSYLGAIMLRLPVYQIGVGQTLLKHLHILNYLHICQDTNWSPCILLLSSAS